jgi:hypothetical protein
MRNKATQQFSLMATLSIQSKTPIGSNSFEYTYTCDCSPKPPKEITVTAANDEEAQALAQTDCDNYCGVNESRTNIL